MVNYDGSCEGDCYMCICQECNGNCAMNCLLYNDTEEFAKMDDGISHIVECPFYEPITED